MHNSLIIFILCILMKMMKKCYNKVVKIVTTSLINLHKKNIKSVALCAII